MAKKKSAAEPELAKAYRTLFQEAPKRLAAMVEDPAVKDEIRARILMWMAEMVCGKPRQQPETESAAGQTVEEYLRELERQGQQHRL